MHQDLTALTNVARADPNTLQEVDVLEIYINEFTIVLNSVLLIISLLTLTALEEPNQGTRTHLYQPSCPTTLHLHTALAVDKAGTCHQKTRYSKPAL